MFDEILTPLLTTGWGRRAGLSAMLGAGLVLLWILFDAFGTAYEDIKLVRSSTAKVSTSLEVDDTANLIASIPKLHLFGEAGKLGSGARLPVTSLQLRLVGVIKSVPEKYSRVIISESGKPGKVYQIGDSLTSGVRIYAIIPDGVILDNGGSLEKLPLQRPPLLLQGPPKPLLQHEPLQEE